MPQVKVYFNSRDRKTNILRSSAVSTGCSGVNILMGFLYRTVFLHFLSASYLGINGLFTNVLTLLSLAELGITSAITFRFYQPIKDENIEQVGRLMNFFRSVYRVILLVIIALGLALLPVIDHLVADPSEVPADVNLRFVYILFLIQTASTYMFSYKQTMLTVDQNQHIFSLCQTGISFLRYLAQIAVLFAWQDYTITLVTGIGTTILLNFIVSFWVSRRYARVFEVKEKLPKEEQSGIFKDTRAVLCHRVGGTVLTSTDNIVLTKFVSLAVTGIYSNYSLITTSLTTLLNQVFGSFIASIGNAFVDLPRERFLEMYRRLINLNFWVVGLVTALLYLLIDDFMGIWLGSGYVLDAVTVAVIAVQFYLDMTRIISTCFTNATGLFVRDKARPLIKAALNIVISIAAVKMIGIPGVFLGTIISDIVTVTWREPYLLYRYVFKTGVGAYWKDFTLQTCVSAAIILLLKLLCARFLPVSNIFIWIVKGMLIFLVYVLVTAAVYSRSGIFRYYLQLAEARLRSRAGRKAE